MRLHRWIGALALLSAAACSPSEEGAAQAAGTSFDESFRRFARLCAGGDLAEAEPLAEELRTRADGDASADWLERMGGVNKARILRRLMGGLGIGEQAARPLGADERGVLVQWTLGVARAEAGAVQNAEIDFEAVRAQGRGELRMDGMYGLGWLDLGLAETLYGRIPEVQGASLDPMSPGFQPQAAGAEDGDEPDPLELAKSAYKLSLEHFLERLALDWRDADTRANVELIQRRLRRLEEIEKERQQDEGTDRSQEDPEDQDKQEDDSQESSGEEGAPSDEEQDEDSDPKESEESDEEQEGSEEDSEEDSESESDEEAGEQDENPEDKQDAETKEVFLTEEEMKRLLETTLQHNQEGEEMRAKMKTKGRVPTERDW